MSWEFLPVSCTIALIGERIRHRLASRTTVHDGTRPSALIGTGEFTARFVSTCLDLITPVGDSDVLPVSAGVADGLPPDGRFRGRLMALVATKPRDSAPRRRRRVMTD